MNDNYSKRWHTVRKGDKKLNNRILISVPIDLKQSVAIIWSDGYSTCWASRDLIQMDGVSIRPQIRASRSMILFILFCLGSVAQRRAKSTVGDAAQSPLFSNILCLNSSQEIWNRESPRQGVHLQQ